MNDQGMRKFAFYLIVFACDVALVSLGIIPPKAFESIAWGVIIAFGGGNVGEHFAKRGMNVQQNT